MTEQVADSLRQAADNAAQVLTTAAPSVSTVKETTEQAVNNLSIWDLTMAGGWLMIPLALLGAFVFHWPVLLVYACTCLDEKGFNWLATTAAGAPMIGFLGTVIGMVQAFFQLASAGNNSNVSILAGGIYQALVTTVAGLIVGIIALFAYNYLTSRVNKVMNKLEGKTMEFMDLLNEPAK